MLNNSKDFQDTLYEVLNKRLNTKSNQEILLQTILKKSDKSDITEFQEMLKKNIKPLYEDRVNKEFGNKIKKEKEKSNDKELDQVNKNQNIGEQVKSGADLNKIANDLDKENGEELESDDTTSNKNSSSELTSREQTLKYMYSVALEEYYSLKENLYKYQLKDNNIAIDDRNYLKLLKYENYLRKCDTLFKESNGSYIAGQDEEISKKENKYAYDDAKSERKLMTEHENSLNEIDELNIEIENKANEIIELNEEAKHGNVKNYEEKLNLLESEYVTLNAKMHMLKPNILELYRQEEEKEEQEQITTRVVGTMYEKRKDKLVMNKDVVRLDKKVDGKNELLHDAAEKEKNELENTNIKVATSYVDAAEVALENGNTNEASHMVNKAKEVVGKDKLEDIVHVKKTDFSSVLKSNVSTGSEDEIKSNIVNQTEEIDNHLENASNGTAELSPVQQECAKAVYPPEQRDENVLIREAKEELEKTSKVKEREQDLIR